MQLMRSIVSDGGEWNMFVNLVQKYGAVPQSAQPEVVSSDESSSVPQVAIEKLREYGRDLRSAHKSGAGIDELRKMKDEMMNTIYRMYCIYYGEPVKTFDFKVRNKDGEYICDRGITPIEFYNKYVGVDLDQYVALTAGSSNGAELKKYVRPDSGNVIEGKPIDHVSVSADVLKKTAIAQIKAGEPVWFGCDVLERSWRDGGVLDDDIYGFKELFNVSLDMSREDRFNYGEAHMSHAMVLKGVDLDENGKPLTWRVENTWGPDVGKKGMFTMTDKWFDKYTYQVIINRKYVPEEILKVYDGESAIALERWQKNV
jgi:bleomycin hydrolase